ncbi:hypothetical protein JX265_009275 [Neoarthrinium moseri]|uniref:Uncharacterized protein n=1 Tax=Neoarthrinium moseri TaxID=1658444 RepID=A0A9Q0ALX3_9PEZI|nr:uncharacterized protein JN550_013448 [Neoarthrinium moseri]KAI1840506.1 hypothetical protein JX266_013292 [Neoarthrinium moseri]KAI1857052.1 hypothetical protein JN550_013448 [Neoarthrinium moseri]KAI1862561.1 hypothetical protein JX265_009275 [Neoarthrinium moseri]
MYYPTFVSAALVAFLATASAAPANKFNTRVGTVATKTSGEKLVQRAATDAQATGGASSNPLDALLGGAGGAGGATGGLDQLLGGLTGGATGGGNAAGGATGGLDQLLGGLTGGATGGNAGGATGGLSQLLGGLAKKQAEKAE